VKNSLFIAILLAVILFVTACSSPTPTPTEVKLPALPTPDVPPIEEVDAAIEAWENSNTTDYFFEVDQQNQTEQFKILLVVEEGEIRAAQRLDLDLTGTWGEPYSIPHEEAQPYTVGSLLARIRTDVLGEGNSLLNMVTAFNSVIGYPLLVHAEALPTYTDSGNLELNRQYSYDILTKFKPLLEDTYGTNASPIYSFTRSDGPEAWCDNLRIFPDGSSIYVDDCRNIFWRIPTPESRLEMINALRERFENLEHTRIEDGQTQRLVIPGTGQDSADAATIEEAWQLTAELHDLLSAPTGLGLVMSYVFDGDYYGFDVFNKITLPGQLTQSGELRGAVLTPDGKHLAYSDDDGLTVFTLETQTGQQLLPAPDDGYYLPRSWSNTGRLLVSHYPGNEDHQIQHGWLSLEDGTWHDLPTPEDVTGYGCDTGADWSPTGDQLVISGLGYGESCNTSPGLTIINLSSNTAEVIIAPQLEPLEEDGPSLIAGAHTPAWSPDGSWIAFGLDQNPDEVANFSTRLYRAHPDGSNLTPLTNNSQGYATHPVWAPDGSLYYGLSSADADLDGLYHYSPTENTHTLLLPGAGIHPLSISPDGEFLLYEQGQALKIWRVRLGETVAEIAGDEDRHPNFSGWIVIERDQ
jgi:Tol biopolymer transport system component